MTLRAAAIFYTFRLELEPDVYMHNASMCVHVYTVYTSAIFYFVATWPFDPLLLNQLIDYV